MLIPLRSGELEKLIPAVATGSQFKMAMGNPQKVLQRIMVSSIGGVITLLISQSQGQNQFGSILLLAGVVFLLYILWGPILEASRKNSKLRKFSNVALFNGFISSVSLKEKIESRHEQANKRGELELVENRRTWMIIELEDEEGYLGKISFPLDKKHQSIRQGSRIICLVFSLTRNFERISAFSDAWIPSQRLWVGEYPFLLRPAFEDLCRYRILKNYS